MAITTNFAPFANLKASANSSAYNALIDWINRVPGLSDSLINAQNSIRFEFDPTLKSSASYDAANPSGPTIKIRPSDLASGNILSHSIQMLAALIGHELNHHLFKKVADDAYDDIKNNSLGTDLERAARYVDDMLMYEARAFYEAYLIGKNIGKYDEASLSFKTDNGDGSNIETTKGVRDI